jgi:transposase-like protein
MNCPHCDSTTIAERMKKTALGYRTFHCHTCKRIFNERTGTPFNYLEYPTDLVPLVVLWRLRYKLSLRDLAEMCLARGFEVTHETIRDWEERFAPLMEPASGPQVLFSSKALPDCGTAAGSLPQALLLGELAQQELQTYLQVALRELLFDGPLRQLTRKLQDLFIVLTQSAHLSDQALHFLTLRSSQRPRLPALQLFLKEPEILCLGLKRANHPRDRRVIQDVGFRFRL